MSYTTMNSELDQNIAFANTYLGVNGTNSAFWEADAVVTPAISGLTTAAVLQSLIDHVRREKGIE